MIPNRGTRGKNTPAPPLEIDHPSPFVTAVVTDGKGSVLLVLDEVGWTLPWGSFIGGEDWEKSLASALYKACGIAPKKSRLVGLYSGAESTRPSRVGLVACFAVEEYSGEIRSELIRWQPADRIAEIQSLSEAERRRVTDAVAMGKIPVLA